LTAVRPYESVRIGHGHRGRAATNRTWHVVFDLSSVRLVTTSRQWVLARSPGDRLSIDDFTLEEVQQRPCQDGEVLCRTLWLSIDAAGRAWMQGRTYRDQVVAGDVMPGFGIAEVIESHNDRLPPGTLVTGDIGWTDHVAMPARELQILTPTAPLPTYLSVLGITGLTAYFGLREVGAARAGDCVVVSAAAGATGSLVGQIAKRDGCRVVGICGSQAKMDWLTGELGFDAAVSHRSENLRRDLKAACPDGVDVYFDNVGGPVLEAVLGRMRSHGRIACCGVVSQYDTTTPSPGPAGVPGLLVTKRLKMEGFIVMDYAARFDQALGDLTAWLADGSLRATEDVLVGIESAPDGLVGLLAGDSVGKRLIHVADAGSPPA
jgi:NADPH-dependent curcumin reductase CurA